MTMIARCDECHAMLAVETLGEWVEHHPDGSHTHHFQPLCTCADMLPEGDEPSPCPLHGWMGERA